MLISIGFPFSIIISLNPRNVVFYILDVDVVSNILLMLPHRASSPPGCAVRVLSLHDTSEVLAVPRRNKYRPINRAARDSLVSVAAFNSRNLGEND